MALPSDFIDDLIARSDIVDVVGDYVRLTQKGGSYWGLCPFHGEKTASFHVLPDRQLYHCFGCGKGGSVISFVMEVENLPYIDALRVLAKRAGVPFPERQEDDSLRRKRQRLLALNREAARFFHAQLKAPENPAGRNYLSARGLSPKTITRFGLGYAPNSWNSLLQAMVEKGYSKSEMLEAGLAVAGKQGSIYDRFRNRVIFPIIDLRGEVIGFGGRVLGDEVPKYLNSPDSPVFNKSRNLFALNLAKSNSIGKIVLTEGYMDTISLYQAGFDCAVASLGTSLTADHAKLLSKFTKEVVICYDSDSAGAQAVSRAIPLLERCGLKVSVLRIPGAKDPDEFIRKNGQKAFARLLDQSENRVDYNLRQLQAGFNLDDLVQKTEFVRKAAELLSGLDSSIEREVFAGRVAESTGVSLNAILQEIESNRNRNLRAARRKQDRKALTPTASMQPAERALRYDNPRSARAEEEIVHLLLLDPTLLGRMYDLKAEEFSSPHLAKIYTLLSQRIREGRSVSLAGMEGELEPAESRLLADILRRPHSLERAVQAVQDCIAVIKNESVRRSGEVSDETLMAALEAVRKTKRTGDGSL